MKMVLFYIHSRMMLSLTQFNGERIMEAKEMNKAFEPKIEIFDAFSVPFAGAKKAVEEIKPVEACCACTACTACTACG